MQLYRQTAAVAAETIHSADVFLYHNLCIISTCTRMSLLSLDRKLSACHHLKWKNGLRGTLLINAFINKKTDGNEGKLTGINTIHQSVNNYFNPLNCSGVRQLHLKVFTAIQV